MIIVKNTTVSSQSSIQINDLQRSCQHSAKKRTKCPQSANGSVDKIGVSVSRMVVNVLVLYRLGREVRSRIPIENLCLFNNPRAILYLKVGVLFLVNRTVLFSLK